MFSGTTLEISVLKPLTLIDYSRKATTAWPPLMTDDASPRLMIAFKVPITPPNFFFVS